MLPNSELRQQRWHHPTAVMRDPDLLPKFPDIAALLPQGDREQTAAADRTLAGLNGVTESCAESPTDAGHARRCCW